MCQGTWKSQRTAGVRSIDEQHGILQDGLNELRIALKQGQECDAVRILLNRLAELARMHVASEERLLEQNHFPGLADYREKQKQLLRFLDTRPAYCNSESRFRQSDSVYDLADFLRVWFVAHAEEAGTQYGPWLLEHGIK